MKCEEFEQMGLGSAHDTSLSEVERAAAREHASACSHCAALQDSWNATGAALREFAEDTAMAQTPARVEMRLRQEFRTRHVTLKVRRRAVLAAWALAAAAVVVGVVGLRNWRKSTSEQAANRSSGNLDASPLTPEQPAAGKPDSGTSESLMADSELSDFTLLPGVLSADAADGAILRVRLQRSSLGSLGLPVNEERAAEWIQVDLLVGNDGLPQAVRLPQE